MKTIRSDALQSQHAYTDDTWHAKVVQLVTMWETQECLALKHLNLSQKSVSQFWKQLLVEYIKETFLKIGLKTKKHFQAPAIHSISKPGKYKKVGSKFYFNK